MRASISIEHPSEGVALVVLDRPERLNALDDELLTRTLPDTFTALADDDDVRVVVITGAGAGFCAGADLDSAAFAQPSAVDAATFTRSLQRTPVAIRKLGKPSVAAVNGVAVGAGFGLALACDLRLAAPAARFGTPFIHMGLVPDFGISYFLPRVVGTAAALDLLLTGRIVDADEALRLRIVSRQCDDVVSEAVDLAATLAANPPWATSMTRASVYGAMESGLEAAVLDLEVHLQSVALHGSEFPPRFRQWRDEIKH